MNTCYVYVNTNISKCENKEPYDVNTPLHFWHSTISACDCISLGYECIILAYEYQKWSGVFTFYYFGVWIYCFGVWMNYFGVWDTPCGSISDTDTLKQYVPLFHKQCGTFIWVICNSISDQRTTQLFLRICNSISEITRNSISVISVMRNSIPGISVIQLYLWPK